MFFSAWASSLKHVLCLHHMRLHLPSSSTCYPPWWRSQSYSCRYDLKLVRVLLLLDFCSSFHIFSSKGGKKALGSTGIRTRQCSVLLAEVWEGKNRFCYQWCSYGDPCQQTATPAMPCKGHSLLQLAAEILPTLNLSITSYQCVTALIKLYTPKVSWKCPLITTGGSGFRKYIVKM